MKSAGFRVHEDEKAILQIQKEREEIARECKTNWMKVIELSRKLLDKEPFTNLPISNEINKKEESGERKLHLGALSSLDHLQAKKKEEDEESDDLDFQGMLKEMENKINQEVSNYMNFLDEMKNSAKINEHDSKILQSLEQEVKRLQQSLQVEDLNKKLDDPDNAHRELLRKKTRACKKKLQQILKNNPKENVWDDYEKLKKMEKETQEHKKKRAKTAMEFLKNTPPVNRLQKRSSSEQGFVDRDKPTNTSPQELKHEPLYPYKPKPIKMKTKPKVDEKLSVKARKITQLSHSEIMQQKFLNWNSTDRGRVEAIKKKYEEKKNLKRTPSPTIWRKNVAKKEKYGKI